MGKGSAVNPENYVRMPQYNRPTPFSLFANVFLEQTIDGFPQVPILLSDPNSMITIGSAPASGTPVVLPVVVQNTGCLTITVMFFANPGEGSAEPPPPLTWAPPWDGITNAMMTATGENMGYMAIATSPFNMSNFSNNRNGAFTPYYTYMPGYAHATSHFNALTFKNGNTMFCCGLYGPGFLPTAWMQGMRPGGEKPVKGLTWKGIGPNVNGSDNTPYSAYLGGQNILGEVPAWQPMCTFNKQRYGSSLSGYASCNYWASVTYTLDISKCPSIVDITVDKLLLTRYNCAWPKPANWAVAQPKSDKKGYPANTVSEYVFNKYPFYVTNGDTILTDVFIELTVANVKCPSASFTDPATVIQWGTAQAEPVMQVTMVSAVSTDRTGFLVQFIPIGMFDKKGNIDPDKYDATKVNFEFMAVKQVQMYNLYNEGIYVFKQANQPFGPFQKTPTSQWFSPSPVVIDPAAYCGEYMVKIIRVRLVSWPTPGVQDFYLVTGTASMHVNFKPQPTESVVTEFGCVSGNEYIPFVDQSTSYWDVRAETDPSKNPTENTYFNTTLYAKVKKSTKEGWTPPPSVTVTLQWGSQSEAQVPQVGQEMPFIYETGRRPSNIPAGLVFGPEMESGMALGSLDLVPTGNTFYPFFWGQSIDAVHGIQELLGAGPVSLWGSQSSHSGTFKRDPIQGKFSYPWTVNDWVTQPGVFKTHQLYYPSPNPFSAEELEIDSTYGWSYPYVEGGKLLKDVIQPDPDTVLYTAKIRFYMFANDMWFPGGEVGSGINFAKAMQSWYGRPWFAYGVAVPEGAGTALHQRRMMLNTAPFVVSPTFAKDVVASCVWKKMPAWAKTVGQPVTVINLPTDLLLPPAIGDQLYFVADASGVSGSFTDAVSLADANTPHVDWVATQPIESVVPLPPPTFSQLPSGKLAYTLTVSSAQMASVLSGSIGYFSILFPAIKDPVTVNASFLSLRDVSVSSQPPPPSLNPVKQVVWVAGKNGYNLPSKTNTPLPLGTPMYLRLILDQDWYTSGNDSTVIPTVSWQGTDPNFYAINASVQHEVLGGGVHSLRCTLVSAFPDNLPTVTGMFVIKFPGMDPLTMSACFDNAALENSRPRGK